MKRSVNISWIIWYAILLQSCWGAMLIFSPIITDITAIHSTMLLFKHRGLLAVVYLIAALGSAVSLTTDRFSPFKHFLMLLPQQFLLLISALGAANAMYLSQFADGVIRPRQFLIADQLPSVLIALLHTCAIIERVAGKKGIN